MGNEVSNSSSLVDLGWTFFCFNFHESYCNKLFVLLLNPHFYKRRQGKGGVRTDLCNITFRDTEQHFIWGRLDHSLLGVPLKPTMHRTGSEWATGWALPTSSGNHGISRDACPWWEAVTGATWESNSAGPDGISSRAHLFGSTNIWNGRYSDKDTRYLISLKIKKLQTYYLPQRDWGRQREAHRWPSHEQSHPLGWQRQKEVCPILWVWIVSPTESKGYVEVLSPNISEGDLTWKWGHCKCNLSRWGEAIPE